jgi:hypothetical protein
MAPAPPIHRILTQSAIDRTRRIANLPAMRKLAVLLIFCLSLGVSLWGKGIRYGMDQAEVQAILGKPTSVLTRGPRLILLYPKNGRIELEKGVAVSIANLPIDMEEPSASPVSAKPAKTDKAVKSSLPDDDGVQVAADAEVERQRQAMQRRLEEATEKLSENHGKVTFEIGPKPAAFWTGLVAGLVFRTLLTVVVLKMAFKWSDVHADWGQMFIPALADTFTQAIISAAVFAIWKTDQLFHLDVAVSYFVLLWVLMKTTHACTLQRAVAVAGAAKLASIVMWALLSVMILNLLT